MADDVMIPTGAVSDGKDLVGPTKALLQGLQLMGTDAENASAQGLSGTFGGPPQSVALIEAGASAASKWWASAGGAGVIATWTAFNHWFSDIKEPSLKVAVVIAAAVVSAALVLAIGYLLSTDVRARGTAAAATIRARADLALAMIGGAETLHQRPAKSTRELIALPTALEVTNPHGHDGDEANHWLAVAMERDDDGKLRYVVVKGCEEERRLIDEIRFVAPSNGHARAVAISRS